MTFTATVTGGGTGNVTFMDGSTPLGTGALSGTQATFTTSGLSAGSQGLTAVYEGDATHGASTSPLLTQVVNKATPTFTFDLSTMSAQTYGDGSFSIAGWAHATLGDTGAITFATGPGSHGCSITSAGLLTITDAAVGSNICLIEAFLAADPNFVAAGPVSQSIHIAKATLNVAPDAQSMVFGDPVPTYTFDITGWFHGDTAGTAAGFVAPTCTSSYTPTTPTSSSPLTISCSGGSADNYTFTFDTASLSIAAADATFDFSLDTLPAKHYGSGTFNLNGFVTKPAGDNGAVTFALSEGSFGCTVTPAGIVTITSPATGDNRCIIEASLAADGSYNAAGPIACLVQYRQGDHHGHS